MSDIAIQVASLSPVEYNLGLVWYETRARDTGFSTQSLDINLSRRDYIVANQTSLFYDVNAKFI